MDIGSSNGNDISAIENNIEFWKEKDFSDLPKELQMKIFSLFPPKELSKIIAPVCRSWWLLSNDSSFWKELTCRITSEDSMRSYCELLHRPCTRSLQSLIVQSYVLVNPLVLNTSSLAHLKKIDLGYCFTLNKDSFAALVSNCPLLENVNLEGCSPGVDLEAIALIVQLKRLKILNLSACRAVDDHCMRLIAENCRLEFLDVEGTGRITDESVCILARQSSDTLRHLKIQASMLTDESLIQLSSCKLLMTLSLECASLLTDAALEAISALCYLKTFKVIISPAITADALKKFFSNIKRSSLEELYFLNLALNDSTLKMLSLTCKNLRNLTLYWCRNITNEGMKAVLENCASLRRLDLMGLEKVTHETYAQIPTKLPGLTYLNMDCSNAILDSLASELEKQMPTLTVDSSFRARASTHWTPYSRSSCPVYHVDGTVAGIMTYASKPSI